MTISDVATIVGVSASDGELDRLRLAGRHAAKFLRQRQGILLTDVSTHEEAFESLARASGDGERMDRGQAELDRANEWFREAGAPKEIKDVEAAAMTLYLPQLAGAYYLGFALGLRLAAGGGVR